MTQTEYPVVDFKNPEGRRLVPADSKGRIVCKKYPPDTMTKGGLIIPDRSQSAPPGVAWITDADAVATNEGFNVGDTVYVPDYLANQADLAGLGDDLFYLNAAGEAIYHWTRKDSDNA